jgi:hypothetical protein
MPRFTIRRVVPDATREDVDAAAFRAIACATEYDGLKWIRSYWDETGHELLCLYEAANADQIREHSRRARIPCDEVREVVEVGPEEYLHA